MLLMDKRVIRDINGLTVSLSGLSLEFGIARETVARRLAFAEVRADGEANGHPVFRLGAAARALVMAELPGGVVSVSPEEMTPQDRKAWYQSEKDRLTVELQQGALVTAEDCREQLAAVVKATAQMLDTLPDILERDCGLQAGELDRVEGMIRRLREDWAEGVAA